MSAHLVGLNDEQARAVQATQGPLLILAGAGSGKTRVLTRRIAYMIENDHIRPWNILAVTFTNKAAGEMKERVAGLLPHLGAEVGPGGKREGNVWVSTFHSTCVRILRRDIGHLGYERSFVIYDDDDQTRVLKQVLAELKLDPKQHPPAGFRSAIDRAKNALRVPTEKDENPFLGRVYRGYTERMKAANALDFNDIVNMVVKVWEEQPEVLNHWRAKFRYVLVDEYQDTNPAQYKLIKLLCDYESLSLPWGEVIKGRNLAVVGDDDQSIYSFRGADIQNILDFEKDFPSATVVRLEQNYRSTQTILDAASSLVKRNVQRKEKTLWTDADQGGLIRVIRADDEPNEAARVTDEIRRILRGTSRPADIAIIYRTNAQSRPFEQALLQARIPHVLVGGKKFYERREVRDLVSYMKLVVNPADDIAFARIINVPTRGLGDKAVQQITDEAARFGISLRQAAKNLGQQSGRVGNALAAFTMMMDNFERRAHLVTPGELVAEIAEKTGYRAELEAEKTDEAQGRLENIEALSQAVEEDDGLDVELDNYGEPVPALPQMPMDKLRAFLDRVSLAGQADELPDQDAGAVTLLTAHLAKGLEYPIVFVVGLVEKCFPHARAEREEEIEEERRLAYVAITRAREQLFLTLPARRMMRVGGDMRWDQTIASRFLRELPAKLLTGDVPAAATAARPFQAPRAPTPPTRAPYSSPSSGSPAYSGFPPPRAAASPAPRPSDLGGGGFTRPAAPRLTPAVAPVGIRKLVPDDLESFRVGVEVFHPLLGVGTISKREGGPANPKLTIHFRDHGPRPVYAVSAGLEILLS
ncbi:MAG: UvrD-helicase domain-containing protein [Pseudomonadota bacterium]|nr:UvrD-helicase domain-containing protein [Pseudomonadota bacterium]